MTCWNHFIILVVLTALQLSGSRAVILFPNEHNVVSEERLHLIANKIPDSSRNIHLVRTTRNLAETTSGFSIYNSIWDFTLDLVRKVQVASDQEPNSVFSPISITCALSLLLRGASKQTYSELKEALRYPALVSDAYIMTEWKEILTFLKNGKLGVTLNIANAIFHNNNFDVKNEFRNNATVFYKSDILGIDFEYQQNLINNWINDETLGNIPQLYDVPLPQSTKMVVANAVYFYGLWKYPFSKDFTRKEYFNVNSVKKVKVPMMVNIVNIPYAESKTLGCKIINMPYEGSQPQNGPEVGMFFILPQEGGEAGLRRLESQLTRVNIQNLISSMETKLMSLHLPRVKVEQSLQLKAALQTLNVRTMFNPAKANFSRFSDDYHGIFADNIIHKAVVKISESGTEAAAATAVTLDRSGTSLTFKADQPFIFFIWHKKDTVLFWGRVVEPIPLTEGEL